MPTPTTPFGTSEPIPHPRSHLLRRCLLLALLATLLGGLPKRDPNPSPDVELVQRGSTLITTNKGVRDWPEILAGDEVLATAILDRPLHNSHVLDIKGCSYRLRDLERMVAQQG